MIVLLFGVSNVGKTTVGELIADRIGWQFFDMDREIIKRLGMQLDEIETRYPEYFERQKHKAEVLFDLLQECTDDTVIAVTPLGYVQFYETVLSYKDILAIELRDRIECIYDRLVFSDENDVAYRDDAYKDAHSDYYLRDITEDIRYFEQFYADIKTKCDMDGHSAEEVADELVELIRKSEA